MMAESRRVQLTTLSFVGSIPASCGPCGPSTPQAPQGPPGVPQGPPRVPQDPQDGSAEPRTVRLVVTLFEPDERSFPEFSYSQLVDDQKIKHTKDKVQLSRFEEEEKRENDEIAAISRKLEEKYGGKPTKKKKDRIQDLIDIGFGYDEEDSFIDNSEAYDEFVPASLSTKFGGFYVNSGVLQFRQTSETEDPVTEEETPEPSKKRKVSGGREKPKRKRCRDDGERNGDLEVKSSAVSEMGHNDDTKKKKKKSSSTLSVTSMLKKFQREKEKERLTMAANRRSVAMTTPALCPADAGGGGGSGLTDPLLSLIGSTNDTALIQAANAVDLDIDLDSLLDVTEETPQPAQPGAETPLARPRTEDPTRSQVLQTEQVLVPPQTGSGSVLVPSQTGSGSVLVPSQTGSGSVLVPPQTGSGSVLVPPQTGSGSPHHGVPLPEGLPTRLEDSIQKLMVVAKASEGESKLKFFTPEINSILLDIEVQCRDLGVQLRSKVYTHLSSFLPCSRDALLKRVKRLLVAHVEELLDVDGPMLKLKEAIGRAMPEQIADFNQSCQVYEQEGKVKASVGPEDGLEEKGGKRGAGGPRKLFKWNEEIRESLCQVLRVKMEQHQKEGKASQEVENQLKMLLDNEVQPLWPKGWMQSRVLIRESRKMLSIFTSLPVKRSRPERKQSAASDGGALPQGLPQDGGGIPQGLPQDGGGAKPQGLPQDGGGTKPQGLPQDGAKPQGLPQGLPQDGGGAKPQGLPQDGAKPQGLPQDGGGVKPQGLPKDGGGTKPQGLPQDIGGIPQGLPGEDDDDVIIVSSDSSPEEKPVERVKGAGESVKDTAPSTPSEVDQHAVRAPAVSTATHSLLDILADQALARETPLSISQELLAAAVAKYRGSAQRWSFGPDSKSPLRLPPPPPPPPQSRPVGLLLSGQCHVVLPRLLQVGHIAARTETEHVNIISDDDDVTVM